LDSRFFLFWLVFYSFLDAWIGELSGMEVRERVVSRFPATFLAGGWSLLMWLFSAIFLKFLSENLDGDRGLLLDYTRYEQEQGVVLASPN
jgi:hypothetical protein